MKPTQTAIESMGPDDPRLTAYVLGELSATERAAVEARLAASPECRRAALEIREVGALVTSQLEAEALDPLTAPHHAAIEMHLEERERRDRARRHVRVIAWTITASAATIVLTALSVTYVSRRNLAQQEISDHAIALRLANLESKKDMLLSGNPIDVGSVSFVEDLQASAAGETVDAYSFNLQSDAPFTATGAASGMDGGFRGTRGGRAHSGGTTGPAKLQALGYFRDGNITACGLPAVGSEEQPATEAYSRVDENPFLEVARNPLSTFSIDVDTASYANVRRFLNTGTLPPKDSVRIEELINYFVYDYPQPPGDGPFGVDVEVADCPWNPDHRLARIGLKGREVLASNRPASNLVFLVDVSGSMNETNKLPLVKRSLRLLLDKLDERDRVAMVVYAGSSGLVLPSTSSGEKASIAQAIDRLESGGSTNGGEGIQLAYDVASKGKIAGGINRVILATDGDFNVGVTSEGDLTRLVEEQAKSGVFLSVLGFGMGNLKDSMLEKLADRGNGNYAYVDSLEEARKVLVEQMGATLQTIAKDVKIQVEFDPATVSGYRLLGYENRMLRQEDFNDDAKDAGEIGAGHTVTAFYEIVPAGKTVPTPGVDALKYQATPTSTASTGSVELLTVKLRYKEPDGETSRLLEQAAIDSGATLERASDDFRFASAVAAFGMILRQSPHQRAFTFDAVRDLASGARGVDAAGYRAEFLTLVEKARTIAGRDH